jgi:hypothetical protein
MECECRAHRTGLDLRLELGDKPRLPLRLSMDRVLQPLEQLLEVGNPNLERLNASGIGLGRLIALGVALILARRRCSTELPDAPEQSLAVSQRQVRPPLGSRSGSEIATAADSDAKGGSASRLSSRNPTTSRGPATGCSGRPHSGHASRYIPAAGLQRSRHSGQQARIIVDPFCAAAHNGANGNRRGGHCHPPLSSSD